MKFVAQFQENMADKLVPPSLFQEIVPIIRAPPKVSSENEFLYGVVRSVHGVSNFGTHQKKGESY